MTDEHAEAPDQLPVKLSEWQELHRLLGMTSARLLPTDHRLEDVTAWDQALTFDLSPKVPATLRDGDHGTQLAGRWTITHVRMSTHGLDLIVERRLDGRRSRRAVPIAAVTHVEQALR